MIARRLAPALALSALALALPASAAADGYLYIEDGASLGPSDPLPDSVYFVPDGIGGPYEPSNPVTSVERGGVVVAASQYSSTSLTLPDLRDGDVIVSRDGTKNDRPILGTFTYRAALHADEPVCSGRTSYVGSRTPGSYYLWASSALWLPSGTNGGGSYGVPGYGYYPGGADGFYPTEGYPGNIRAVGEDRFLYEMGRPTTAGMQLFLSESYRSGDLYVTTRVEQLVKDCPPAAQPGTPGSPGAPGTPGGSTPGTPVKDTKAPVVSVKGLGAGTLRKLGLTKLLKRGLPITLTLDEAGKVKAKITLVKGKRKTKLTTSTKSVVKGKNSLRFAFSKSAKKRITAAKKTGKLRIELTVVDAAGNTKVLPPVTVKIPR